jgi:predicted ribosomally synthesized peptide with SipW-like signal peptide
MQTIKTTKSFDGIIRPKKVLPVAKLEYTSQPKKMEKNVFVYSSLKVAGVFCIALVLMIGLSSVGGTISYFNDVEKTVANRLQAGILSLRLNSNVKEEAKTFVSENNIVNNLNEHIGSSSFEVNVDEEDEGLPMLYTVIAKLDESNPAGCEQMNLKADFSGFHYDGEVEKLNPPATTDLGSWYFLASLPIDGTDLAPNAECNGEIIFKAGLAGVSSSTTKTYSDEKTYPFSVYNWGSGEEVKSKSSLLVNESEEVTTTEEIRENNTDAPQGTSSTEPDINPIVPETPKLDLGGSVNGGSSSSAPEPTPTPEPTPVPLSTPSPEPVTPPPPATTPEPSGDVPPEDIGPPPTEVETETSVVNPEPVTPPTPEPTPAVDQT